MLIRYNYCKDLVIQLPLMAYYSLALSSLRPYEFKNNIFLTHKLKVMSLIIFLHLTLPSISKSYSEITTSLSLKKERKSSSIILSCVLSLIKSCKDVMKEAESSTIVENTYSCLLLIYLTFKEKDIFNNN